MLFQTHSLRGSSPPEIFPCPGPITAASSLLCKLEGGPCPQRLSSKSRSENAGRSRPWFCTGMFAFCSQWKTGQECRCHAGLVCLGGGGWHLSLLTADTEPEFFNIKYLQCPSQVVNSYPHLKVEKAEVHRSLLAYPRSLSTMTASGLSRLHCPLLSRAQASSAI